MRALEDVLASAHELYRSLLHGIGDQTAVEGQEDTIYLPYRSVAFFYGEFEFMARKVPNAQR